MSSPSKPPAPGIGAPRPTSVILALAVAISAVVLSLFHIANTETWLHLATGRLIVESHGIPNVDPFSHTMAGAPWVVHSWLGSVLLYLVDGIGGIPGLIVFRALTVLAVVAGWLTICRGRRGAILGVALLAPFVLGFAPRFTVRPSLITTVLIVWQLVLVDMALRGGKRWPLIALLPLYVVWVNLDVGALMGWLFLLAYVGGIALQTSLLSEESRQEEMAQGVSMPSAFVRALPWVLLALVVMVLNPNHIRVFFHPFQLAPSWLKLTGLENLSVLDQLELQSQLSGASEVFNRIVMFAVMAIVMWAISLGRLNLGATTLLIVSGILALFRARHLVDFGVLSVALIGPAFGESLASMARRWASRWRSDGTAILSRFHLVMAALILAVIVLTTWVNFPRTGADRFGFGFDRARYPERAFEFLAAHRPATGNGFNSHDWGGALLWHFGGEVPVYMDDRLLFYGKEFLSGDYLRVSSAFIQEPSWSDLLAEHDVSWILIHHGGHTQALEGALNSIQKSRVPAEREWGLVWFDDTAQIFMRRDAFDESEWHELNLGFDADVEWMREISPALIRNHPEWIERLVNLINTEPHNRLAVSLLLAAEENTGAEEWRIFALEHRLEFSLTVVERAHTEYALGVALGRAGELEAALTHLEASLDLAPEDVDTLLAKAAIMWNLRRVEETVRTYERVLELDPENVTAGEALRENRAGTLWDDHPEGPVDPVE